MLEPVAIGVVVLNWNRTALTLDCLDSLRDSQTRPFKVVVVDNASTDGSVEKFQQWANRSSLAPQLIVEGEDASSSDAWLTIIRAKANRGFAHGNNLGIRYLRDRTCSTHVLLLNNDATAAPDFFDEMSSAVRGAPDAGLITGTIFEAHGDRSKVWYAGGIEIPRRALMAHLHNVPTGSALVDTEFVSGCTMLIPRATLDAVGDLAECYSPVYWEDAEYSHRVRALGKKLLYAPKAVVYHKVGATVGAAKESPLVTYCQNRHRVFFVRRNYHGMQKLVALGYLFATKPARAMLEVLRGNGRIGAAIFRGFASGLFSSAARGD